MKRAKALDILPTIGYGYPEIFIKATKKEAVNWLIFLKPLSMKIWFTLVPIAIITAGLLTGLDRLFRKKDKMFCLNFILIYFGNFWVALKANFGGTPSSSPTNTTHKIVLFVLLLGGNVVWMAYTASLTSELSVVKLKLPFKDMESLSNTDYR